MKHLPIFRIDNSSSESPKNIKLCKSEFKEPTFGLLTIATLGKVTKYDNKNFSIVPHKAKFLTWVFHVWSQTSGEKYPQSKNLKFLKVLINQRRYNGCEGS